MLLHQERVVEEKEELDAKIEKLAIFIKEPTMFNVVAPFEQGLLLWQLDIMSMYSRVLKERIRRFEV